MRNYAKKSRLSLCCGLLLALPLGALATVEAQDSEGRLITLDKPATRVVALAPHIVENLFSVGAQETIVGTVEYSDFPAQATLIPRVGGVGTMSLEKILSIQPDLVILWGSGTSPGLRSNIDRLGLPYFVDEIRSLEELGDSLRALGILTGNGEQGQRVAEELHQAVSRLSDEHGQKNWETEHATPGVFLQLWDKPLQSIGKSHLLNEVIERCGGQSITRAALGLAPVISLERVLADDPALIIVESQEQAQHWQKYRQLSATKGAGIAVINPDVLHRPSLRLVEGMTQVCASISAISDRL